MEQYIGKIVRLNRKQEKLKQEYICVKTGIARSQLSRYERNKEKISTDNIKNIFQVMNIEVYPHDENTFEKDFLSFYEDIAYENDFQNSYRRILSYYPQIRATTSYIKYLLACMIYNIHTQLVNDIKEYFYMTDYFEYLEPYQQQLYYDYLGIFLFQRERYIESLEYYNKADFYTGNHVSLSMLYYHKSIIYTILGKYSEARLSINVAIEQFIETVNMKRILMSKFHYANIQSNSGHFDEAIFIYKKCIPAFDNMNMSNYVKSTYNNLLWVYIQDEKYKEVIMTYFQKMDQDTHNHKIYFYLSYAYYQLNEKEKAIHYIELAKYYMNQASEYMENMINSFSIFLSNATFDKKEAYLLKVYHICEKRHENYLIIFIIKFLIQFYKEHHCIQQTYTFQNQLIKYYEEIS